MAARKKAKLEYRVEAHIDYSAVTDGLEAELKRVLGSFENEPHDSNTREAIVDTVLNVIGERTKRATVVQVTSVPGQTEQS
jgi:hypothetical protein